MNTRWYYLGGGYPPILALAIFLTSFTSLPAAQRNGRYYEDSNSTAICEIQNNVETLKHRVSNNESEISVFDEKLKTLDTIIESVRDQLNDSTKNHKEQLKGNTSSLEMKISSLETTSKGLVSDLRQLQSHANESAAALAQYKQKFSELEKLIIQQNQDLEHMQAAIRSLMDILQGKAASGTSTDTTDADSGNLYKVKSGDSLEKIARAHGVTIQSLKDTNGLTSDRIVVGKTLKIPTK